MANKPVNAEVVVGRLHIEKAIRLFSKKCKRDGLLEEIREKSPLGKPRFKSKRDKRLAKQKKYRLEMQRIERKKKKALERRSRGPKIRR